MHQGLQAADVVMTLERLSARIQDRFPQSGLARVCTDLTGTARGITRRARGIADPYLMVRMAIVLVLGSAAAALYLAARDGPWARLGLAQDAASLTQGLDAAVHLCLLAGAAVWFLISLETRLKRARALRDLHELRSFAHVVDMHQLTKDPTVLLSRAARTANSPDRAMTRFQLTRYLDYCAEMLALIGKLAALYSEYTRDPQIVSAVNDVENLSTNLGRKIWQKITILSQLDEGDEAAA